MANNNNAPLGRELKVGIVASELYDGGEIIWTRSLVAALNGLAYINQITVYLNKDYASFQTWLTNNPVLAHKVRLEQVTWRFRFMTDTIGKTVEAIKHLGASKLPWLQGITGNIGKINANDICIFPNLLVEAQYCKIPYVITPQDVRDKYNTQKPDTIRRLKDLFKNYADRSAIRNASAIVCESNFVKHDIIDYYGVSADKIMLAVCPPAIAAKPIPTPKAFTELADKYNLPARYLFYPAHLIEDKNHIRLIEAIDIIRQKHGMTVNLALAGSKKGHFDVIMDKIKGLGLENNIKYLGYVDDEDMPHLYQYATALVMPTLFESVSLPIWEAFHLGTAVISSNVCALPEQVGDAGVIFDPLSPQDMAEKIYTVWQDEKLRQTLIQKGRQRIQAVNFANYTKDWDNILQKALQTAT